MNTREHKMTTINKAPENLDDALIDVETRFLYTLPESELNQTDRLFFQIEQAYWYYEDFKADRYSHLPHFTHLKQFAKKIFEHCDLLKNKMNQFPALFESFANYKAKIPVCGCILLNPSMNKLVLVCNWDGKSWSFPRGKIDEKETEYACAIREVYEETGYNPSSHCNENEFLVCFQDQKKVQLFIGTNVPESTVFQSRTRKEISKIEFFDINNLPKTTFLVHPFIPKLKRWIEKKQKALNKNNHSSSLKSPNLTAQQASNFTILKKGQAVAAGLNTTPNRKLKEGKGNNDKGITERDKDTPSRLLKRRVNTIDAKNIDTFALFPSIGAPERKEDYLENMNAESYRWSVEEMFKANAKITGKEYDYDGNPHSFGASHPKFVNYRNYNDLLKHNKKSQKLPTTSSSLLLPSSENSLFDLDFANLSLQSQQLGEKFLRGGEKGSGNGGNSRLEGGIAAKSFDEKEFDMFRLPNSALQHLNNAENFESERKTAPTFFQLPFKFDTKEIMSEIDAVLVNFSFE